MKRIKINIVSTAIVALSIVGFTSCADYLDREPGTTVDAEAAFKNYTNFQGFVDAAYDGVPHKETHYWQTTFNWGEDEIVSVSDKGNQMLTPQIDNGNFWAYFTGESLSYLYGTAGANDGRQQARLWNDAWKKIRICNLGLANIDKVTATQEEINVLMGQLYFFRAWYYEEMMLYWGGLPYITEVPSASEKLTYPRLSFRECAELAAADFGKAAELLPNDWDESSVGRKTMGQNDLRITKATALGYKGKVLLWSASPLNEKGAKTGGTDTYSYNTEIARQAADALGECINLIETGQTPYSLAEFKYTNVYDHEKSKSAKSCFSEIFFTKNQDWLQPGSTEAMMRGPKGGKNDDAAWHFCTLWGSAINQLFEGPLTLVPTANYVNYAYGMANGKPAYIVKDGKLVINEESGFDPTHPFKDRDPRFYHDIVFDGFHYISLNAAGDFSNQEYCTLYTGGLQRDKESASRTGYFCQKLIPHTANQVDKDGRNNINGSHNKAYLPYMRVADIYLMYAEAGAAVGGSSFKSDKCSRTAVDAINVLRDRVGAGHVDAAYTSSKENFMDEVRRERACELAFEGFRFNDLQRWLLLTERPYNIKTSQEFIRVQSEDWYKENDPRDAEVKGWSETELVTRNFTTRNYWFPIPESEVYLYKEYGQNPGW